MVRFARVYTPIVVLLAVLVAVLPPLAGLGKFSLWFGRALVFLVVSCPCALVLSVPLTYFAGIGAASKCGILVKGGGDLDTLSRLKTVVFDKTGTLTKGRFSVTEVKGDVLKPAAIGEAMSNHPIAQAIVQAYKGELPAAQGYQELGGYGISYELDGETVLLGNSRLMEHEKIAYEKANGIGTVVYVAKGGKFLGYILVADTLKENIADSLAALRKQGIQKMVMLTGDRRETAAAVAEELRLDEFHSELLPENKVEWMEKQKGAEGDKTAFVGDGINDAPVLAAADLGIAMGAIGSDAAIEAADVVLMDDDIGKLAVGMKVARNTRRIVNQNDLTLRFWCCCFSIALRRCGWRYSGCRRLHWVAGNSECNATMCRSRDLRMSKSVSTYWQFHQLNSKLAVFLVGNEFRLRIPFGKRSCFPSPSAASKLLCLQSERGIRGYPVFYCSFGMIFFTFFSNFALGSMTMCPQPQHLMRKSMPVLRISHWAEPQGWLFFICTISPTEKSIRYASFIKWTTC